VRYRLFAAGNRVMPLFALAVALWVVAHTTGYDQALLTALRPLGGFGGPSDLLQDLVGARALRHGGDLYPPLGPAIAALGVDWPLTHRSTHPPSAFLFLLPLADLSWPVVAKVWAIGMLLVLGGAWWAFRPATRWWLVAPLLLLWPPILSALGQFTPVWLLGLSLVWHWRQRAFVAGVCIGLASLPKFLPAVALLPYVRARRWEALAGFGAVWLGAFAVLIALDPAAPVAYLLAQRVTSLEQAARDDNGAMLAVAFHTFGQFGGIVGVVFLAVVVICAWQRPFDDAGGWALWCWLTVALLPIAWVYSLVPLLPGLLRAVRGGNGVVRTLAIMGMAAPWIGAMAGSAPASVALAIGLSGGALILDTRHLLMPKQAAAILGVNHRTVRGYVQRGLLPVAERINARLIRVARADVDRLKANPPRPGPIPTNPPARTAPD